MRRGKFNSDSRVILIATPMSTTANIYCCFDDGALAFWIGTSVSV